VPAPPLSKTASANGLARQPTRLTRRRLMIVLGVIFVGGIVAAALDLRFVIGGAPRRVEPNSILALDPRTMASVSDRKGGFAAPSPVRAAGLVWTVDGDRNLVIATNPFSKRVFRQEVVGTDPVAVAVGYGAAWVANAGNGSITRVPLVGSKIETLGLDDQPSAIATGAGYVWVVSRRSGKVIRIDPKTKQVDKSVRLANPPLAVAVRPPGRVELEIGD
jgi:DNA-binding beta-propeller fold protein YncE